MPFLDNKTITVLDITYLSVKCVLKFCGRSKKKFLETLIYYNFSEYYTDGIISDELDEMIKRCQMKYERKSIDDPLYLNWDKNDPIDMKTATLLNIMLGSGASDFVEILICSSLKTVRSQDFDIKPINVEKTTKTNTTANIQKYIPKAKPETNEETIAVSFIEAGTDAVATKPETTEEISFEKITESQFDD